MRVGVDERDSMVIARTTWLSAAPADAIGRDVRR